MSFSQLTIEKRFFIQKAKDKGLSNKEIAHSLGCHPTTVGRELKRNSKGGHYIVSCKSCICLLTVIVNYRLYFF